jgi:hypothetical protein
MTTRRISKSYNINPYEIKVAISTGAKKKGRSFFPAGSVKVLKNEWQSMGVQIVEPYKADYVIVPDGTTDIGHISAIPIFYSEFVNLLASTPFRPQPVSVPKKDTTRDRNDRENKDMQHIDITDFNYDKEFLEEKLRKSSKKNEERRPGMPRSVPILPKKLISTTKPVVTQFVPQFVPSFEPVTTLPSTALRPRIILSVNESTSMEVMNQFLKPSYQNFITEIYDDRKDFYFEMYTTRYKLLQQFINSMYQLLRYWAEIRINVESLLMLDDRIEIDDASPCQLPESTMKKLNYLTHPTQWMSECWVHYRNHFNTEKQNIVSHYDLLSELPKQKYSEFQTYFWEIETDLYLMFVSLQCAKIMLNNRFSKWARTVRDRFEKFQLTKSCSDFESSECNGMCLFRNGQCVERPLIFVLDELVAAYCGSSDILPISLPDQKMLLVLLDLYYDLYKKWFGQTLPESLSADFENPFSRACEHILILHNIIMGVLKRELGFSDKESIMWSAIPEILDVSLEDWNKLWSSDEHERQVVIQHLNRAIQSDSYKRFIKDLVISLSDL